MSTEKLKKRIKRANIIDTRFYPIKCCSKCGTDTNIIDSRPSNNGVWRRRECPVCKARFTTYEILEEDFGKLESVSKQAARLKRIIKATLYKLEGEEEST